MQKKLSTTAIILIVVAAVLVLAVAAAAIFVISTGNKAEIYPNIYAGGVNIGGMSQEEAVAAIEQNLADSYGKSTLKVDLGDRVVEFTPDVVNAQVNAEEIVADAWAFGRGGNVFSRAATYLKAKKANVTYTVNAGLTIDEAAIRALIDQTAEEVYQDAVESQAQVNEAEDYIEVTIGTAGRALDADALFMQVTTAIYENNFETIEFAYEEKPYPAFDLTRIYNTVYTPVEDAYYDAETHEIVEEQIGYGFDLAAANQQIAMAADGEVIRIALEEVLPEETKAHLEEIYFADVIGSCETTGLGSYNRATNITLACEAINGTVLAPGEVFSFNNTVGERTAEKGYLQAGAYNQGRSVSEYGGGICQVSSTIYYACLMANLEITVRSEHMYTVAYLPLGLDATVNWGTHDYQFKNNTDYPIRIETKVEGGYCKVQLIGTKVDDTYVEMTYEVLNTIPYTTTVTDDPEEVNGTGRTGYYVASYRHIYDGNGNEISCELEDYSSYMKSDIVVLKSTIEDEVDNRLEEEEPDEPVDPPTTPTDPPAPPADPPTTPTDPPAPPADPPADPVTPPEGGTTGSVT